MDDALLTCAEAARLLRIRPATIRAWTRTGLIPSVKLGRKVVRYPLAELERFIRAGARTGRVSGS
jgi:excisionase family DNA binding protein